MEAIKALVLRDMLAAYVKTLAHRRSFDPDEQCDLAFFRANRNHDVCRVNLIAALHDFAPNASLECLPGIFVQADSEGALMFRDWTIRPQGRKAVATCN